MPITVKHYKSGRPTVQEQQEREQLEQELAKVRDVSELRQLIQAGKKALQQPAPKMDESGPPAEQPKWLDSILMRQLALESQLAAMAEARSKGTERKEAKRKDSSEDSNSGDNEDDDEDNLDKFFDKDEINPYELDGEDAKQRQKEKRRQEKEARKQREEEARQDEKKKAKESKSKDSKATKSKAKSGEGKKDSKRKQEPLSEDEEDVCHKLVRDADSSSESESSDSDTSSSESGSSGDSSRKHKKKTRKRRRGYHSREMPPQIDINAGTKAFELWHQKWNLYIQRHAKGLSKREVKEFLQEEIQRALTDDSLQYINSLSSLPKHPSASEIIEELRSYIFSTTSIVKLMYEAFTRMQGEHEQIKDVIIDVDSIVRHFFSVHKDPKSGIASVMFISKIRSQKLRQKLLGLPDKSYHELCEIAKGDELAERQAREIQDVSKSTVYNISQQHRGRSQSRGPSQNRSRSQSRENQSGCCWCGRQQRHE